MIRHRLEVWTRDGSKRRAIFGTLYRAERRQVLQGEEVLNAEVSAQDGALASLVSGSVLRLQREGVAADATLWRLTARGKSRGADNALRYQITADALWMDLRQGIVRQRLIDGRSLYTFGLNGLTPRQWLEDFILPGYEGTAVGFRLGTVEISEPVDLTFERSNPLAALRMLEGAADAEAQFRLDPSGEFYWVDLLERVGAEQGTAELRYGKNLTGLERLEDETDVETRLYAVGSGLLTLADAEWKIGSLSGGTSARVITFDGPSPVFEDHAFTDPGNPVWFRVPGKGNYPITASVESTGRLTVNGSGLPALAAGDIGHLVTDAEGTRLAYLESPAGVADYGVRVGDYAADDVPDAHNQVPNSDLSDWSAGLPTGWLKIGDPTVTEETDRLYAHQGERAARIVASEGEEGLLSPAFELSNPADRPYTALLAGLTLISGSVRLELRRQGGETYPIGERPVLIDLGIYSTMTAGPVHDEPLPAGTYQVAIVAHGSAAEWVLDCAMVTPVIGEEVPAYVAGSGAHLLWERTAWELDERRRPRVEWRIDIADLYRVDPEAFRFDELRMGDSVPVRDPEFPRARPRIVELIQDILDARATQVVLADSARMRVHDPFRPPNPALGGRRAGIGRRSTGTEGAAVMAVQRQWDPTTGKLTIGALGSPVVATLELRTRNNPSGPWLLVDTIAGRQGWFDPLTPTDDLLYQVTPRDGRGVAGEAVEDTWARGAEGEAGEDATAYWLTTGAASIKRDLAGDYTPPKIEVSARSQTGEAAPAAYAGRFIVATLSGNTWTDQYTSPSDEPSHEYTVPAGIDAVRVRLYMAGGTTALLDEVVVPVVEDGPEGASAETQYSGPTPGQNIAPTFDPQVHLYARWRRTGEPWPTEWARIVGEEGAPGEDGRYTDYIFRASATQPATPTGPAPSGWSDAPPTVPAGQYLWMSRAVREADGTLVGTWSEPVRLTGPQGPAGASAEVRYSGPAPGQNIASVFNPALHLYMQVRLSSGAWPSEWARIVGEDGDDGTDGIYTDYRFRAAATQPATPTGPNPSGWSDAPPAVPAGQYLWMTTAKRDARTDALLSAWSTPVRLTGPKGDPGDPAVAPPRAFIRLESVTGTTTKTANLRITGENADGSTTGLQYDYVVFYADAPFPGWLDDWQTLPAGGVAKQRVLSPSRHQIALARVRDADGRISIEARVDLQPTDLATHEDVEDAATAARTGAVNDATGVMEGRGLKSGGFTGSIGTGASARPAVQVVDGVDRSLGALTESSRLRTGVEADADIAGQLAAGEVAAQVQEPSQNLLPPGAGATVEVPTGETRYPGGTAATRDIPLSVMGLAPGDVVSYSARGRRVGADGVARIGIGWVDSEGEVMYYDTVDRSATTEGWMVVPAVTVPAGAVAARPFYGHRDGASGAASFRDAMLNRGPIALPFEEPPWRPGRERHLPAGTGIYDTVSIPREVARGIRQGEARHNDTISLSPAFQETPAFISSPGGITFHPALAGHPHGPVINFLQPSPSGAKLYAKLRATAGAPTQKSASFSTGGSGQPSWVATKSESAEAYDQRYIYVVSTSPIFPGDVLKVGYWYHSGTTWVLALVKTFSAQATNDETVIAISGMGAGSMFGLTVEEGIGTLSGSVRWGEATVPGEEEATTDDLPIPYTVIGGT